MKIHMSLLVLPFFHWTGYWERLLTSLVSGGSSHLALQNLNPKYIGKIFLLLWFYTQPCKYANINLKMQTYSDRNQNCNYSFAKLHNGRLIKAGVWLYVLKTDLLSLQCLWFLNVCLPWYNDHACRSNTIIWVPNEPKLCLYSLNDSVREIDY